MEFTGRFADQCHRLARISTRNELLAAAVEFTQRLGFGTVTVFAVADGGGVEPRFDRIDNAPLSYRKLHESVEGRRCDPVMQHCKRSGAPIVWDRDTYLFAGRISKWEVMAAHGYAAGVALALHLPAGRHLCLGVDRDRPLRCGDDEIRRIVGELCLFTTLIQQPALCVLQEGLASEEYDKLTCRELECLRWTIEGKTAWEVGKILSISEQTAARHLCNAARKLGCANKHHAAVKALRVGLIS